MASGQSQRNVLLSITSAVEKTRPWTNYRPVQRGEEVVAKISDYTLKLASRIHDLDQDMTLSVARLYGARSADVRESLFGDINRIAGELMVVKSLYALELGNEAGGMTGAKPTLRKAEDGSIVAVVREADKREHELFFYQLNHEIDAEIEAKCGGKHDCTLSDIPDLGALLESLGKGAGRSRGPRVRVRRGTIDGGAADDLAGLFGGLGDFDESDLGGILALGGDASEQDIARAVFDMLKKKGVIPQDAQFEAGQFMRV